ncbi:MAG: hypothetical protein MJK18_11575, partial [Bdellovibrionales bacterium]|nr:hypothetical protein [Bdellovibrionales bacterium]
QQYDWARQYSAVEFFSRVKRLNQTIVESPQMIVQRNFSNLCSAVNDRVDIVNRGVAHTNSLGGACMNFRDYDTHSTPSRDSGIMNNYESYAFDYQTLIDQGQSGQVQQSYRQLTEIIFANGFDESEQTFVRESCPIRFGQSGGQSLYTDLASFRVALFGGRVSYHPNDNLYRRWGFNQGSKTTCEEFYGYPE